MPVFHRLLALLAAFSLCIPAYGTSTRGSNPKSLVVNQVVTGPDDGVISTIIAREGIAAFQRGVGFGFDQTSKDVNNAAAIGSLRALNYGTGLTQRQVLAQARAHIETERGALFLAIRSYMRANGIGFAVFNYDQRIVVSGSSRPKHLVWTVAFDQHNRPTFANPKVIDEAPMIVYATYTPLRVAQGLPASWAYPNAGVFRWRLVNTHFVPQTDWVAISTGGAFDEPESTDGTSVDPDAGVKCLVDRSSSPACPAGVVDLVSIIDENGAASALLDYTRVLRPVYDSVENPPGSGEFDLVGRISLQVDFREAVYSGCGPVNYRNRGTYGFTLSTTINRYMVTPEGEFAALNEFQGTSLSPTEPYDVAKNGIPLAQSAGLHAKLVDIGNPGGDLLPVDGFPNLISLAALTVSGNTDTSYCCYEAKAGQWYAPVGLAGFVGGVAGSPDNIVQIQALCEPERTDTRHRFRVGAFYSAMCTSHGWKEFSINFSQPVAQFSPTVSVPLAFCGVFPTPVVQYVGNTCANGTCNITFRDIFFGIFPFSSTQELSRSTINFDPGRR